MKFACGATYQEAVTGAPLTHIDPQSNDFHRMLQQFPVVLDFQLVGYHKYCWEYQHHFCYYIKNIKTGKYVMEKKRDGKTKPVALKSKYQAKTWVYYKDKQYFDSLQNLSTMVITNVPEPSTTSLE